MEALQWNSLESTLKKITTEIPEVTNGTVLIKVLYAGVCGTDLHILQNEKITKNCVILGHEFSGTVAKVGTGVDKISIGQNVVVDVKDSCQVCKFCQRGMPNRCNKRTTIGIDQNGGFANYCLVHAKLVIPIPDSLPLDKAALVEPMACVIHGYDLLGQIAEGTKVLVMGAGIIGLLWINMFYHKGFTDVTIVEVAEQRRKIAQTCGLGYDVYHPTELHNKFKEIDANNDGFDVAIDCTGNPTAAEMAIEMLCCGGKLCIFGCPLKTAKITIPQAPIQYKELTIFGANASPHCFPKSVSLLNDMGSKYVNLDTLGVEKFSLDEFESALDKLKTGIISKAMFCLET